VAGAPEFLTLTRNRDNPPYWELVARWVLFAVLTAISAAGLFRVFGQHEVETVARGNGAVLAVSAPVHLRGGVLFQGRFTIAAERDIAKATLVLDRGWMEGMQINTIEPSPVGEASRDGKLALDFGHVARGSRVIAYMQFQVNPTNVGRRSQTVRLYDDEALLTTARRTVTVLP
jgi:hypothetical protein